MPRTTPIMLLLGCHVCARCLASPILLEFEAQLLLCLPILALLGTRRAWQSYSAPQNASGVAGGATRKFLLDHILSELSTVKLYSDKHFNVMIWFYFGLIFVYW